MPEAILCTGCGFNRVTGQRIATQVAPKVVVERAKGGPSRFAGMGGGFAERLKAPWIFGLGSLAFFGLLFLIGLASPKAMFVYIVFLVLYCLIIKIWFVVSAFQDSAVSGVLCLLCDLYAIYFLLFRLDNSHVKWGYVVCILAIFLGVIGASTHPELSSVPGSSGNLSFPE